MVQRAYQGYRPSFAQVKFDETKFFSPEEKRDLMLSRLDKGESHLIGDLVKEPTTQLVRTALRTASVVVDALSCCKNVTFMLGRQSSLKDVTRDITFLCKDTFRLGSSSFQLTLAIIGSVGQVIHTKSGLKILVLVHKIDVKLDRWTGGETIVQEPVCFSLPEMSLGLGSILKKEFQQELVRQNHFSEGDLVETDEAIVNAPKTTRIYLQDECEDESDIDDDKSLRNSKDVEERESAQLEREKEGVSYDKFLQALRKIAFEEVAENEDCVTDLHLNEDFEKKSDKFGEVDTPSVYEDGDSFIEDPYPDNLHEIFTQAMREK